MNMGKTYINITISYWSNHALKPTVYYYRSQDGQEPYFTIDKLTVDEANRLMWELVKLGGKNAYESNPFKNSLSERRVTFYGRL